MLDGWGEAVAVVAFLVVTAIWQIGRIIRAPAPAVQAIKTLAVIVTAVQWSRTKKKESGGEE